MAFAVLLALLAVPALGCGVGTTVAENNRTIRRVWDYDARMLVDDLGELVLCERPFHGSRYPIK
jgi:hypothetical protein